MTRSSSAPAGPHRSAQGSAQRRRHPPQAVLFDMDGVVVDTEGIKARAHQESVARFGGRLSPTEYAAVLGRPSIDVATHLIAQTGIRLTVTEYERTFVTIYEGLLPTEARPTVGVIDFLHRLKTDGYRCALVSSAARGIIDRILGQLRLPQTFDVIVSAEDVATHKPSPEPYTRALSELGVEPLHAVAFEDSESGAEAAAAAGLQVIAVRHALNRQHDFSKADAEISGFEDLASVLQLTRSRLGG